MGKALLRFLNERSAFFLKKPPGLFYRMDVHPEPKKKVPDKKSPATKEPKNPKKTQNGIQKQPAESSSEENCSQMSSEEETKESSAIKKKNVGSFDTSTKRGIRKQAREDIRILKFESRQLKKRTKKR